MAVPSGQRSESKLEAQVVVDELVKHTIHIMSNEKVFDPKYGMLSDRVIDCVIGIGQDMWEANLIRVNNSPRKWAYRKGLQDRAIRGFATLLYLIRLCRHTYHLRKGKYEHWVQMARDAKNCARAWRESDVRRYGHLASGNAG